MSRTKSAGFERRNENVELKTSDCESGTASAGLRVPRRGLASEKVCCRTEINRSLAQKKKKQQIAVLREGLRRLAEQRSEQARQKRDCRG